MKIYTAKLLQYNIKVMQYRESSVNTFIIPHLLILFIITFAILMKRLMFFMLSFFCLLSCSNSYIDSEIVSEDVVPNDYVNVNFLPKGLDIIKTRSVVSDAGLYGSYIIDEQEGMVNNYKFCLAEEDLYIPLKLGTHKAYLVSTKSKASDLDTNEKMLTFYDVDDTYFWSGDIDVKPYMGNIEAEVKRMNYKLSFILSDKIPADATNVSVLITIYYNKLNLAGGTIDTGDTFIKNITITDEQKNLDYGATFSICGFSPNENEYTTGCSVTFLDSDNNAITEQHFDVPLQNGYHTKVMGNYSQISTSFTPVIDVSYMGEKEVIF